MIREKEFEPREVRDEEEAAADAYQNICDDGVNRVRTKAAKFEPGQAGDCDYCGDYFARVVKRPRGMACAGCRDDLKLG